MPARSKAQQKAAGIALAAKRGEIDQSKLAGAARQMSDSMTEEQLEELASKDVEQLPPKVPKESKEPAKAEEVPAESSEAALKRPIGKGGRRPAKKAAKKAPKKVAKKAAKKTTRKKAARGATKTKARKRSAKAKKKRR